MTRAASWPINRLTQLLQIQRPLVLSPMAGIVSVDMAAAVSNTGALGSFGCVGMDADELRIAFEAIRALTASPVNYNFFCHNESIDDRERERERERAWLERLRPYYDELGLPVPDTVPSFEIPSFDSAICDVVEAERPSVVSFHFGLPGAKLVERLQDAGCRILSTATTVIEAQWLERNGADAIIAQGREAGGHRGSFLAPDVAPEIMLETRSLVPLIVGSVQVPVIAAGGIADAASAAAMIDAGASGVQIGTAYLLCPEAEISDAYRAALMAGSSRTSVVTNAFTGRFARVLENRLTRDLGAFVADLPHFPRPAAAIAPIRAEAQKRGDDGLTPFWAGERGASDRGLTARELTDAFFDEMHELLT